MENPVIDTTFPKDDGFNLDFNIHKVDNAAIDFWLCLINHILTYKPIYVKFMKERLTNIWTPLKGVFILEIKEGMFLLRFFHSIDV